MIYGIGTDIVSVKRIEKSLAKFGDRFLHKILNDVEVAEYAQTPHPARFLAKRFAVKEAFSKAYGTGIGAEVSLHDVGLTHDPRGKPMIAPKTCSASVPSGVMPHSAPSFMSISHKARP